MTKVQPVNVDEISWEIISEVEVEVNGLTFAGQYTSSDGEIDITKVTLSDDTRDLLPLFDKVCPDFEGQLVDLLAAQAQKEAEDAKDERSTDDE